MVCPIAQIKDCNLLFVFLSLFADNGKQKNFNKKIYLYLYQIIIKIRLLVDPFFIALDFPLKLQSNCNREAIRQVYLSSVLESCPTIARYKGRVASVSVLFCRRLDSTPDSIVQTIYSKKYESERAMAPISSTGDRHHDENYAIYMRTIDRSHVHHLIPSMERSGGTGPMRCTLLPSECSSRPSVS
jgi:hypothetical protein